MKAKILLTGVACMMTFFTLAQETPAPVPPPPPPAPEHDTSRFNLGKTTHVLVIEEKGHENTTTEADTIVDIDTDADEGGDFGHWSGLDLAVTGYLTYDNKVTLPTELTPFELDYARCISVNWNFMEKRIRIVKDYFAITTGLGLNWNRYSFKNNNTPTYNSDSVYMVPITGIDFSKNVLRSTYINLPLLFDFNTSKKANKSFHISFGVIGGYRLGSKLKQKFEYENQETTAKNKGHYHLNPFQANAHVSVGFGQFTVFANYGLLRVFEEGKGPQLYPFSVGIKLLDF